VSADVADLVGDVLDGAAAIEVAFAAELAATPAQHRRVLLAALRSACGDAHRRRLVTQGLDDAAVRASVARTVRALLRA
jgi:hypothetical protein